MRDTCFGKLFKVLIRLKDTNMIRHEQGELIYFSYSLFTSYEQILSAVSSRQGGMSEKPFASLNVALSVGDDPDVVMINRERLCKTIGVEVDAMTIAQLVQGTQIEVVMSSSRGLKAAEKARRFVDTDGLITNSADIPLFNFIADCAAHSFIDSNRT